MNRDEAMRNLRQLLELDRGFGMEFIGRGGLTSAPPGPLAEPPAAVQRPEAPPPSAVAASPAPAAPAPAPPPIAMPASSIEAIAAEVRSCMRCELCRTRTNTVPGDGNPNAELVFVGEGPGADEDAQGLPFVGAAGQLLDRMIVAMGLSRREVYICNVVKCRPPGNRTPEPAEVAACVGFLHRQLATIRPKVICTLGNTPLRALMENDRLGITSQRGKRLEWRGIPLIPTFHPSYLLRNPPAKKPCWDDLKVVLEVLGRQPPPRQPAAPTGG